MAKNRQEEAEKILAVQFDSNVGVAAVVKQSDPCNVRAVVEDEFSGNSNQVGISLHHYAVFVGLSKVVCRVCSLNSL